MKVDIVEIGTSDFNTEAGKLNGLFVEPVREHFDRLPQCRKENVAVSNRSGIIHIYYIPTETIEKEGLPNWVRGCNSIGEPHETIVNQGWAKYLRCDIVPLVRIKTLIDKYEITDIDFLKIDTEGHDCVILNDFLDTCDIKPSKIQFEANILSDEKEVNKLIDRLKKHGYNCSKLKFDVVCFLS